MIKFNLHRIAFAVTIGGLFLFNWQYGNETVLFYGFSENKELEIRLEHPISLEQIYVTADMRVKKGDLLLEVKRSGLELTSSDLHHDIAKFQSEHDMWEANLKSNIRNLEAQKSAKENEIKSQIYQLESEMAINQSLIKDLESIKPIKDNSGQSPNQIKIAGLRDELSFSVKPLEEEISKLKHELQETKNPLKIQIQKTKSKIDFVEREEDNLKIFAPNDGIVGTINCKKGEQISAYTTLMTFYDEIPSQISAYVLESLLLKVNLGDTLEVNSSIRESESCLGKVIGMGTRIVEIPERLRKNPTFKTYGREIKIQIPVNNSFLQKEKVIIKIPQKESTIDKLGFAFFAKTKPILPNKPLSIKSFNH